jgi:hypothetical protein
MEITPTSNISEALKRFEPITLSEMDGVSLMNRTDTKFIFPTEKLSEILSELTTTYRSLEINGNRFANYKTDYLDTFNNDLHTQHQNGKQNRYKVRFREYVGSNLSFLEVKFKNSKGKTNKSRIKAWGNKPEEKELHAKFIVDKTPYSLDQLKHILTNNFSRITLVNKTDKERLTIDFNLNFKSSSKNIDLYNLVIAEVKQEKVNRDSKVIQVLKTHGVREASFSKYATGAVLLDNNLKYNNFKKNLLFLNKIHKNGNIWNRPI